MKRIIVILAALLLSISTFAQHGKNIYQKYSDAEGVTAVYISPAMFRLIGKIPDMELQDESVYEAMLRIRLEEVKRRLRQTDDSIAEITAACGWENPAPPKALFKKRFGMSMRDYRNGVGTTAAK